MRKIVMITPTLSEKVAKGYEVVLASWVGILRPQFTIEIISLSRSSIPKALTHIPIVMFEATWYRKLYNLVRALTFLQPFQTWFYFSKEAFDYLAEQDKFGNAVFVFFTLRTHSLSKAVNRNKKIIHAVDSMQLNFEGKSAKEVNLLRKALYKFEYKLLMSREAQIITEYHKSIFVAQRDIDYLKLKNSVEIPLVTSWRRGKASGSEKKGFVVGLSGNFNYSPNIRAARYLIDMVIPLLPSTIEVRFIGFNAERFKADAEENHNIVIRSDVEDIASELERLNVSIAPMQDGSGMQNKILAAMAGGIPVITNEFGLGSIRAIHNESILLFESAEQLVGHVLKIRNDPAFARKIAEGGSRVIDRFYSESAVYEMINAALRG